MKNSIVLVAAAFLCLVAFPTTTVGKNLKTWPNPIEGWPNPIEGWPKPSELRKEMFMSTAQKYNYGDSKVWKCTYSNGSSPAISISYPVPPTPSTPSPSAPSNPTPSPSTPSTPSPSTPSTPSTPSIPPPTPKTSPPPPTPSPPPSTPKTSPPPPTPSPPPSIPKTFPPPPTPSPPLSIPKTSPPPPVPSLPPPTPKKSPSPPPRSEQPFHPHPGHHYSRHHHQNGWEHIDSCMRNMGQLGMCRMQMEFTYNTRMFNVCNYCCNLIVNMRNECDDVAWGVFIDPFFLPLIRSTCHVNLL